MEPSLTANSSSVLGEVHRTAAGRERDGEAMPTQLRDCRVLAGAVHCLRACLQPRRPAHEV